MGEGSARERELLGKARAALTRYHERLREEPAQPLWFERQFTFDLGPHHVRGRVDRVDRLPEGGWELIDYKTGYAKTAEELSDDIQLSLYAIAAREAWGLTDTRQAYYYVLDDRKVPVPADAGSGSLGEAGGAGGRGGNPRAELRAHPLACGVRALRLPDRVPGGGAVAGRHVLPPRGREVGPPAPGDGRSSNVASGEVPEFCKDGLVPTREQIMKALEVVIDPELRRSIVELEMVRSVEIGSSGVVDVTVSLTTAGCPIRGHFQTSVAQAVGALEGVAHVNVFFDVLSDAEKAALRERLGRASLPEGALAQVRNVVCIGSGKGGVGKSTLTANLAAALSAEGQRAGVLDADVWGYSIPRMYGLGATRPPVSAQRKIIPLEAHGVRVMSIGFFVEEDAAVVWRGPMLHKALSQFLQDVEWGELDHLLIDLPPGTGDVSMTLAQLLPQARS